LAECRASVEPLSLYSQRRIAFLRAMLDWLTNPDAWLSLVTLTVLEIVLGVDNIIFISILSGKLPAEQQGKARNIGLALALITRILLLSFIFVLTKLTAPLFTVPFIHEHGTGAPLAITGQRLVLIVGGLFLLWKSVHEIHGNLEGEAQSESKKVKGALAAVIAQIVVVDIIFSLDSVITAVGMAQQIGVMITAVILAMIVMFLAAKSIADFVNRHPTIKMLALSFLMLVGVVLVADGCGQHIEKGYIYFAMAFSFVVEVLNIRARAKRATQPVELRSEY
jgi:predicted tellurium resistance membrane protein TerC